MFCSKCGKQIDDEAVICPNCGCSTQNMTEGKIKTQAAAQYVGAAVKKDDKPNNKMIIAIIAIACVIIGVVVAIILAKLGGSSGGDYSSANSMAKLAYTNAVTYSALCEASGNLTVTGKYKINISKESSGYQKNGRDLENAIQSLMGSKNQKGYVLIEIKSGYVQNAYYCNKDCFGLDYSSFDISKANNKKYTIGSYPDSNYEGKY